MENHYIECIRICFWGAGFAFAFFLLLFFAKAVYRILIKPWRKQPRLTVVDLILARRMPRSEGIFMKLAKLGVWCTGCLFAFFMIINLSMAVFVQSMGMPSRPFVEMAVRQVRSATMPEDLKKILDELGGSKEDALREIKLEIVRMEKKSVAENSPNFVHSAEYKTLCLIRDFLEGKISREEFSEKANISLPTSREGE